MVKGLTRRVVIVDTPDPALFEQAIFIVRDGAFGGMTPEKVIAQAREVAEGKGGLDFQVAQGGRNLSGGQRQRFTIARALVGKPDILILDDSASALDFATDAALRKAIRGLENHPTVFIVSQRASSIQYADQIVVLDDGAVVGLGRHEELLRSCRVYREIYDSQFRKEDRPHG